MGASKVKNFLRKYMMLIATVLVVIAFYFITNGQSLNPDSIDRLISQNAYVFVLGTGMLLCILTGGNIDLSVGSVVCFVGAVGATLMVNKGVNPVIAVIIMFVIGTLIGAWQAFWIAHVRIPPFIVTLSGMLIFRGLSNVVLDGMTVSLQKCPGFVKFFGGGADCYLKDFFGGDGINITCLLITGIAIAIYVFFTVMNRNKRIKKEYEVEKFTPWLVKMIIISVVIGAFGFRLAQHKGVPNVLFIVAAVILVYSYITSNTTTGRYFYAVGGNEKATKLSGINTNKVYFLAYTNMGFLAALAGMITIARLTSAQPTYGQNYEMDAIASCFIGGASAYGGIGTVPGVIIGALLMGVINLGMFAMNVDQNYQKVVKGLVLLVAVIFDVVSKRGGKLLAKNA